MGNYNKKLRERLYVNGPKKGYCAICRDYKPLTADHVPPKGCNNSHDIIMSSFGDYHNNPKNPKGIISQSGMKFRTICGSCNNDLLGGKYDPALIDFSNKIIGKLPKTQNDWLMEPSVVTIECDVGLISRAVVGHLLAANASHEVTKNEAYRAFSEAMRCFFLQEDSSVPDSLGIHFWIHPYKKIELHKYLCRSCFYRGILWQGHVLKFDPLGFLVTWNETQVSYPGVYNLLEAKVNEGYSSILISRKFCPHEGFPLALPDDSSEFTLMPSGQTIYATSRKK